MNDWIFTLPFLCGFLYACGGRPKGRYLRRIGIGLAVAIYAYIFTGHITVWLSVFSYWIATAIGYGKYIERRNWLRIAIIGMNYGLASFFVAYASNNTFLWLQVSLSTVIFTGVVYWANTGRWRLHWAFCEGFTGIGATALIPYMILIPKGG